MVHLNLIPFGFINLNKEIQNDLILNPTGVRFVDIHFSIIENFLWVKLKRKQANVFLISHNNFFYFTLRNLAFGWLGQSGRQNLKITKRFLLEQINRKSFNMIKINSVEFVFILPTFNTFDKSLDINLLSQSFTLVRKLNS